MTAAMSVTLTLLLASPAVYAAGEIDTVLTTDLAANPSIVNSSNDGNAEQYFWGRGRNQQIDGFVYNGFNYRYVSAAAEVHVRRVSHPEVIANSCRVFAERLQGSENTLQPDFPAPSLPTGELLADACDPQTVLGERTINRGIIDVFSNSGDNAGNIERIDYLFSAGLITPVLPDEMHSSGHMISEMGADNATQVAAVLELDADGEPLRYGPLVTINPAGCTDADSLCFGLTDLAHDYSVFSSDAESAGGTLTRRFDTNGTVGMAFVSVEALGLQPAQTYYGVSFFPIDVDPAVHNLADPASFPMQTAQAAATTGDSADFYGGSAAYFLLGSVSVAIGHVFIDQNGDGLQDSGEQGLGDLTLELYADSNGNGVLDGGDEQILDELLSDQFGNIVVPALPIGQYMMTLDMDDPDLPADLILQGSNPFVFSVIPGGVCDINFPFSQPSVVIADGTDDGGGAGGGTTTGGAGDTAGGTAGDTGGAGSGADSGDGIGSGTDSGVGSGAGTDAGSDAGSDAGGGADSGAGPGADTGADSGDGSDSAGSGGSGGSSTAGDNDNEGGQGDGDQGEGTRFSDINNNGLNDFDECECDDLTLVTGVHGSGIGGGGGAVLLVFLMPWILAIRVKGLFSRRRLGIDQ